MRLASLLLVLLFAAPVYAQSTVQVIDNRYDTSASDEMRTSFEVSVRYAATEGLTNLGTLLELVNAQPNLTRAELNGNGDQARLSVRFSFTTSDELNAFVARTETTEMLEILTEKGRAAASAEASNSTPVCGFPETPTLLTIGLSHLRDCKSIVRSIINLHNAILIHFMSYPQPFRLFRAR